MIFDFLDDLHIQFLQLREQLYVERMNQVEIQLSEVRCGRSQEYLGPLQSLVDTMNSRKEVAEILKKFRLENIRHKYESEAQAARQHLESEKQLALDNINDELMDKIRRLEEDSHNVDINWADWGNTTRTSSSKVRGPGRKKAVSVSGPFVVYMLKEEDILEDWTAIRKALATKKTTSVAT
jgi:breast cancer metastasis-suppressor 1-like protein